MEGKLEETIQNKAWREKKMENVEQGIEIWKRERGGLTYILWEF